MQIAESKTGVLQGSKALKINEKIPCNFQKTVYNKKRGISNMAKILLAILVSLMAVFSTVAMVRNYSNCEPASHGLLLCRNDGFANYIGVYK